MPLPEEEPIVHPGPARWWWYAVGGRLPERYRGWVVHDLTSRRWPLRHLLRALALLAPVVAVLLAVIPGPAWVSFAGVTAGALLGLLYSCVYMYESAERRISEAGFPPGTAQQVRDRGDAEARAAQAERYAQIWRSGG